jgi:hypothetical protein
MSDGVLEFNYKQKIISKLYVKPLFLIPASKILGVHKYPNLKLRLVQLRGKRCFVNGDHVNRFLGRILASLQLD